jgi:protein-S-isoprenylcysteine O-methyltransferase Ste14
MLGFLLQWPTILTVVMFPILVVMYQRLAHIEEHEMLNQFGEQYADYAAGTPRYQPRFHRERHEPRSTTHSNTG